MADKCPNWEEMARSRGQAVAHGLDGKAYGAGSSIQQQAVRMGASVTLDNPTEEKTHDDQGPTGIQIRLEILRILFSSPNLSPDLGFTTKAVEKWVKTGEGKGLIFSGYLK